MHADIIQYIENVSDARKELFYRIHSIILRLYPAIQTAISYNIPKYYLSKEEWIFVSYNKQGISLHVGYKGKLLEFKAKNPGFSSGKACLHLTPKQDIPWQDVEKLIESAIRPL